MTVCYAELGRVPLLVKRQIQIVKFANRIKNLDEKYLVKKALNVQITDDIKGHFNWVSEVLEIMKDNNIIDPNISDDDINSKLKENYKNDLLKRIHSYAGERKKLRMYAEFKHVIKYESYLDTIKNAEYRIMLSKFRLSSHDLEIERGRYGHKSTNPEERYCKFLSIKR